MVILVFFSFLAGIITILSPCILPVLPILLSAGVDPSGKGGYARPLGIIAGFILSFSLFTLFLSSAVRYLGIPADSLRIIAVGVLILFGLTLLVPRLQHIFESLSGRISGAVSVGYRRPGFVSGLLVGGSLGLLWTPCVGPILGSVISLAVTGTVTVQTFTIILAYSLGTAIPMVCIMIGGQQLIRRIPFLLSGGRTLQGVLGSIMIMTALLIASGLDRRIQTAILTAFPRYGSGLTKLEQSAIISDQLSRLLPSADSRSTGKPMFETLKDIQKAPEIIPGGEWINSEPLTLSALSGNVVLIDFWTYSCINCQRTFPYLRKWWTDYKDSGLVIIGVHSPEFAFEKNSDNVRRAAEDFRLTYPIVQDNEFATWNAYENHFWPAKYLIDANGTIRYTHFGEGGYDETERMIQTLLKERGSSTATVNVENPAYRVYARTPETYLGYHRLENNATIEPLQDDSSATYTAPDPVPYNTVAFSGTWTVTGEYATPEGGASLLLHFDAKEVFLVMGSSASNAAVRVILDGKPLVEGGDIQNGSIPVGEYRLYRVVELPEPGEHTLRLEMEGPGLQLFAFTFG